ncbi:alpha/beta fold hydrolase [Ruegeria sp. EL01]|jgi:pimeloyl-ACP methyl ester carboxylesterase|uniref:alpha/beta fold hydrolase n=1 Tax=Ruegeria sp. EL01 TaxID=2107578 RepID=UPI000EA801A3|nr:alpha/beta hydrolase [Ruegeria sp. EL01]
MTISFQPKEHINAPIVALHSSASNSGQWTQLEADLDGRFTVIAFDLPGYGRTPLAGDLSQKGAAISAAAVIQEIADIGGPVHLVGHSNGGGVAIKVALMRPDLVKSLTLYEPAAFHFLKHTNRTGQRLLQQIQLISGLVTAAAAGDDAAAGMGRFLDFWNGDGFWTNLPTSAKQRFAGMISSVMTDFANGFAETWALRDLSELEIPTLVMTGLESPEVAQYVSVAIAKALPQSRIALLPELGHMAPVFQPEWVNSRIFEHVASVERPIVNCSWPTRKAA